MMGHNKRQMMDLLAREGDQELLKTVNAEREQHYLHGL